MKRTILFALAATLVTTSVAAQAVMRPRPGAGTNAIAKLTPQSAPQSLTTEQLAMRQKPAAAFLPLTQLRTAAGLDPRIIIPDLTSPFQLTPGTQNVEGRGSLLIQGVIHVPNPKPAMFQGQATITRVGSGAPGVGDYGKVEVTINAQKNKFYVVDCLAQIDGGNSYATVEYLIDGSSANAAGNIRPEQSHIVFNVRRTESDGEITIRLRPPRAEGSRPGGSWDINIMDFWGCQISSG